MAESTLTLTKSQLESEVGSFLGYGRGINNGDVTWTDRQTRDINDCLNSGLRMFYFPAPLPGESSSYDWSFMRPTRQITVSAGANTVALPDDFAGLEGNVNIVESGRTGCIIKQTNEQVILNRRNQSQDRTGRPELVAVSIPSTTSLSKGQRSNLLIYPTTDQEYTIEFQYYFLPDSLQTSFPYAMGGGVHSETVKAAVKAAAEIYLDNQPGPMAQMFIERMKASVSLDRRNKAQNLGYNGDPSFNQGWYGRRSSDIRIPVTYNGQNPG